MADNKKLKTFIVNTKDLSTQIRCHECVFGDFSLVFTFENEIVAKFTEWNCCINKDFITDVED